MVSLARENLRHEKSKIALSVAGVILAVFLIFATNINGEKLLISINGFDTASGLGGPWKISRGIATPDRGEAIIDRVLAKKKGLDIGGVIDLEGKQFRIVGISDETFTLISYMVFVTMEDARSFMPANLTNFFLVKANSPSEVARVKTAIESTLPEVSVSTSQENAAQAKDETA